MKSYLKFVNLREFKSRLLRRAFANLRGESAYKKRLINLRRLVNRDFQFIYRDFGVAECLARLKLRPATARERLEIRLKRWYRERDPEYIGTANLVDKLVMRSFIEELNVPLPELYFCDRDLTALRPDTLPTRYVVKPHNGADSKGILLIESDVDTLSGERFDRNDPEFKKAVADFVLNAKGTSPSTKIMFEERMVDSIFPDQAPLDYKVHCYGGKAIFVQVINRHKNNPSQSFYGRAWNRLPHITNAYPEGLTMPKPECLDELLGYADTVASKINQMVRLDFYVTVNGPVFGEVTTFPGAGRNYSSYGNALAIQCWELFPDQPSLY